MNAAEIARDRLANQQFGRSKNMPIIRS